MVNVEMLSRKEFDGKARSAAEAKRLLVLANRILSMEGVVDAYGHVSMRNPENPDSFFISRAIAPAYVCEEDIMECATHDGAVFPHCIGQQPYGERIIHALVYKNRSDINAVVHAHPVELIPFTACDIPFSIVFHSCSMFYDGIPLYKLGEESGMHITTVEEAESMARHMEDKNGLFIANHGIVVGFDMVQKVVMASVYLSQAAEILQKTLAMGGRPRSLTYSEAKKSTEYLFGEVGLARSWEYWVRRAAEMYPDVD